MKPTLSKDARRADAIDKGARIAALIHDPVVEGWFYERLEAQMTALLNACENGSDELMRAEGTKLTALRELRRHLKNVAADGERALKQVSEI